MEKFKKIFKYFILFIVLIAIIFGVVDYRRVRKGDLPLFMIRVSNEHDTYQNYVGLGYLLKRKVNVSYREPFYLDDDIRFGLWFLTWELKQYTSIMYLYTIETDEIKKCDKTQNLYYREDDKNIYTYCLNSIKTNAKEDYKEYMKNNNVKIDDFIKGLVFVGEFNNGEYSVYRDPGKTKYLNHGYTNKGLTVLKCHTKNGNKDIYIGPKGMEYEEEFCK